MAQDFYSALGGRSAWRHFACERKSLVRLAQAVSPALTIVVASCSAERMQLGEERTYFDDGTCRVFDRTTALAQGVNSGYRVHLIVNCGDSGTQKSADDFELLNTRYNKFYAVSAEQPGDVEGGKAKVVIEYCQYRDFTSLDELRSNASRYNERINDSATIQIEVVEDSAPCDEYASLQWRRAHSFTSSVSEGLGRA